MKGLSERFASLQQEEGSSNVGIALRLFTDIFLQEAPTKAPTQQQQEPTQLKVFAAGLPRSGTGSLAVALTELGYTPLHGPGAMELEDVFEEHYEGRASPTDILQWQLDHGYDAQGLDQLGWKLYKEATENYPDAKIILTEHPVDGKAWAESWSSFVPDHIDYFSQPPFSYVSSLRQVMKLQRDFLSYIGEGTTNPRDAKFRFPAPWLAQAYERHNEAVKRTVPEDRLLVFTPTQGWDPLCRFLEVDDQDCPKTPYPRMTDREMMKVMSKVAMVITSVWPFVPYLVGVMILYAYRYRTRQGKQKAE